MLYRVEGDEKNPRMEVSFIGDDRLKKKALIHILLYGWRRAPKLNFIYVKSKEIPFKKWIKTYSGEIGLAILSYHFPLREEQNIFFKKGAYSSGERLYILPPACLQNDFGLAPPIRSKRNTVLVCGFEDETDPEIIFHPKTIADGTFAEVLRQKEQSYFLGIVRNGGLLRTNRKPDYTTKRLLGNNKDIISVRWSGDGRETRRITHIVPMSLLEEIGGAER